MTAAHAHPDRDRLRELIVDLAVVHGTVTLSSGADVAFLDLMADAEAEIASPSSTDEDLRGVLDDLSRVTG